MSAQTVKAEDRMVGVDSNVLTYLVNVIDIDYDPALDTDEVKSERLAMLKIYLRTRCVYYVLPTVFEEYQGMEDPVKKGHHDSLCRSLLLETSNLDRSTLKKRTEELVAKHGGKNDCAVVAEAELAGLDVLLTYDNKMLKRLGPLTHVALMKPSEFLCTLDIPPGAQPLIGPADSNPLSRRHWVRSI